MPLPAAVARDLMQRVLEAIGGVGMREIRSSRENKPNARVNFDGGLGLDFGLLYVIGNS